MGRPSLVPVHQPSCPSLMPPTQRRAPPLVDTPKASRCCCRTGDLKAVLSLPRHWQLPWSSAAAAAAVPLQMPLPPFSPILLGAAQQVQTHGSRLSLAFTGFHWLPTTIPSPPLIPSRGRPAAQDTHGRRINRTRNCMELDACMHVGMPTDAVFMTRSHNCPVSETASNHPLTIP
eukprot:363658-Chlamydomonas_euryale.AAC.11